MRIAIWGTGWMATNIFDEAKNKYDIVYFVDNKWERQHLYFKKIYILSPDDLADKKDEIDGILLAVQNTHEQQRIALQLRKIWTKKIGLFRNTIDYPQGDMNNIGWFDVGEKIIIPYMECNIIDTCNLKCKGCTHFSNLFKDNTVYDIEKFENDLKIISEHIEVARLRLLGGEPLLCDDLERYIDISRSCFPTTDLFIVTNGLLLSEKQTELFNCLRTNNVGVYISGYKPVVKQKDRIIHLLETEGIDYFFSHEIDNFVRFMDFSGTNERVVSFDRCFHKGCVILREGKLYNCPTEALIYKYILHYGIDEFKYNPDTFGNDIRSNDVDWKKIEENICKSVPMCEYCSDKGGEPFPWEVSASPDKNEWCVAKR